MTAPEYEIVATVTGGDCLTPTMTFVAGVPGQPIGIGRAGQWAIAAEGVAPVHLYLAFDGQNLFAAAAIPGAHAVLAGRPLGADWTHVPLPSEVRFGAASIAIARKVPSRAPAYASGGSAAGAGGGGELGWGGERTVHDGGALYAAAQKAMEAAGRAPAPAPAAGRPLDASAASALRGAGAGSAPPGPPVQPTFAPYASSPMPAAAPAASLATAVGAPAPHAAAPQPSVAPPAAANAPSAAVGFWKAASPVKKITLLLLPVVVVMTFLALKQEDDRQAFEAEQAALAVKTRAAAKAAASASAAPVATVARPSEPVAPARDAGAAAAAVDPDEDDDADLEPAPFADAGGKSAKAKGTDKRDRDREKRDSKNKRTPERLALDAVAAGSYAEAAKLYDALAASHPGDPTYREAARILRDRQRVGD